MSAELDLEIAIKVPPGLAQALAQVICDYARQHREDPAECRRSVEIAVLQRGIRLIQDELKENLAMGERMGWRQ